jgi:hypothetical protein
MYLPSIDTAGSFKLKTPFDKLITPNTVYTCRSIRSINDYLALGEQVFEKFYEPLDVDVELYQDDLKNNVKIVSLQAGTGEWVYVPASFIEEAPNNNGVKYVPIVLGVSLGAIPDTFNLESIIAQFKELTLNTLGIESEVKAVVVNHPAYLDHDEHERLEAVRKNKITSETSDKLLIEMQRKEISFLTAKIAELELYIKSTL